MVTFSTGSVLPHVVQQNIVEASRQNGVVTGLAVSERGAGANMSVDVATGEGRANLAKSTKASVTNVTITAADSTKKRIDLITMDDTGTLAAVAGTAAVVPTIPALPADKIALAYVEVAAGVSQINDADITDIRVFVYGSLEEDQINKISALCNARQNEEEGVQLNGDNFFFAEADNFEFAVGDNQAKWDLDNSTGCDCFPTMDQTTVQHRKVFFGGDLFDTYDGSLDTTTNYSSYTTFANITEDSGGKTGGGDANIRLVNTTGDPTTLARLVIKGNDFKSHAGDSSVTFAVNMTKHSGASVVLQIGEDVNSDQTGLTSFSSNDEKVIITLVFDKSAETVDVYRNGVLVDNDKDISSETNWYIHVKANFGGSSQNFDVRIYNVYINDGSVSQATVLTTSQTIESTDTHVFFHKGAFQNGTGDATYDSTEVSFDGGSNYATITEDIFDAIANTGTSFIVRIKVTPPTPDAAKDADSNAPWLPGFGATIHKHP